MLTYKQANVLLDSYQTLKHTIEQLTEEDKNLVIAQLEVLREAFPDLDFHYQ